MPPPGAWSDKNTLGQLGLSKLNDVVKNGVVKKTEYDQLVKISNADQTTDTINLVKKTEYETKITEIEKKLLTMAIVVSILLHKNLIS